MLAARKLNRSTWLSVFNSNTTSSKNWPKCGLARAALGTYKLSAIRAIASAVHVSVSKSSITDALLQSFRLLKNARIEKFYMHYNWILENKFFCQICQIKSLQYFQSKNLRQESDQVMKKVLRIIKSVQIWTILSWNQKPKL